MFEYVAKSRYLTVNRPRGHKSDAKTRPITLSKYS